MGRVVAIGGGDLNSTEKINKHAIGLAKVECPNLLFIGTASHDAKGYLQNIKQAFQKLNCRVKDLSLTEEETTEEMMDKKLHWADIIYVGGGDTEYMMNVWKEYGLDQKLHRIYRNDSAVLMGLSAGAICWFTCGHGEISLGKNEWSFLLVENMLGIYSYALCPHYDEIGREGFDFMLENRKIPGIALENNTAFVEQNGFKYFIHSDKNAKAYLISYADGVIKKEPVHFQEV